MDFKFFSRDGRILPIGEAHVPLSSIEYAYGFGVYESIRVSNGTVYFPDDHIGRLMESARIIGLSHPFTAAGVSDAIVKLLEKNEVTTCNIKILLIGGRTADDAELNILCLNPLFPDKKLYRDGASVVTYEYERSFPRAKTLNMLESYLAYRKAKEVGAYDALLIDSKGCITEGTRTNFFCIQGKTLVSPPEEKILLGVTRKAVLQVAVQNGYEVVQKDIHPADLREYDGAFLTSTSAKILPIRSVDTFQFGEHPDALKKLMAVFDGFLNACRGTM